MRALNAKWKWRSTLTIFLVFFLLFRFTLASDIPGSTIGHVNEKLPASIPKPMEDGRPVVLDSACVFSLLNSYQTLLLLHGLGILVGFLVEILTVYYVGRTLRTSHENEGSNVNKVVVFLLGLWMFFRLNLAFTTVLKKSKPTLPIPPNITWDLSEPWTRDMSMYSDVCFRIFCISTIIMCLGLVLLVFYKNVMKRSNSITITQVIVIFFWMIFACNCVLCYIYNLNEKQMYIFGRMMEASGEGKPMTEPKNCDAFWQVCPLRAIDVALDITMNCTINQPFLNIGTTLKIVTNKLEEMYYG